MKRIYLLLIIFLLSITPVVFAIDYGGVISGEVTLEGDKEVFTSGNAALMPWFSMPIGESDLYISAGLSIFFGEETILVPELFRLEYSFSPIPSLAIRAGRISWSDPSRFTAKGRFDGADFLYDLGSIRLGAAILYTGLLTNETSGINISPSDLKDYANTYLAPPRLLTAVYGEINEFYPFERGNLHAGFIAQFDISNSDYHTQYLLLRHTFVYNIFDTNIAGAAGLVNQADGVKAAFAFSLEGGMSIASVIKDRFSLGLSWSSGNGPNAAAFFPVTTEAQSTVLQPYFSGMMFIRANYEARVLPSLSASLGCRYFIRTDSTSFMDPLLENKSYFLGAEIEGSLLWMPFSDIAIMMTGGVFLPQTGSAFADNAPARWLITLGTILSF